MDPEIAASPILPNGLKKDWIQGGDLCWPAVTHKSMAGSYGEPIPGDPEYVDLYKNYISKLPPMKRYLDHVKLREA
jgi:hypothetical protein